MIRLFAQAPDNPTKGAATDGQSILRLYAQYYLSGLIDLQLPGDEQIVLLIADGVLVGAYHVIQTTADPINVSLLSSYWRRGDTSIRSINLPRQAVRSARELLEWSPPSQLVLVESAGFNEYLGLCQTNASSGLIYLSIDDVEGYISLDRGLPLMHETVLVNSTGVDTGRKDFRQIIERFNSMFTLRFYEIRSGTIAAQQRQLRLAAVDLIKQILPDIQKVIGVKSSGVLLGEIQNEMQANGWRIQLSVDGLRDSHIFNDLEGHANAYRTLFGILHSHLRRFVGRTLAQTILQEGRSRIHLEYQQALNQSGINLP